jgi:Cu+-exporting ATPase
MEAHQHHARERLPRATKLTTESTIEDPVCGMNVDTSSQYWTAYAGGKSYFCSAKCKSRFDKEPSRFRSAVSGSTAKPSQEAAITPAATGTIYTCPMHPEIRQDHPGNCPKCGMT